MNTSKTSEDGSSQPDTPNIHVEQTTPIYEVPTEGSHPLVVCQPCNTQNEDLASVPPALPVMLPLGSLASHATYSATASPAIISATASPATSPSDGVPSNYTPLSEDTPQSTNANETDKCPNRIVDFEELKHKIDAHLGNCRTCKKGRLELVEKRMIGLASSFEIYCEECATNRMQLIKKLNI